MIDRADNGALLLRADVLVTKRGKQVVEKESSVAGKN